MGKVRDVDMVLTSGGKAVRAGDWLRGHVRLVLSRDVDIADVTVRVRLRGRCSVQWSEAKEGLITDVQSAMLNTVMAEEVYLSDCRTLCPEAHAVQPDTRLTSATHIFPFELQVADRAPHSFAGSIGRVVYTLRAVVETAGQPGSSQVTTAVRRITVLSHLDLNTVPTARENVHVSDDLKAKGLFSPSGYCRATLRLARTGFTQGETIPVDYCLHNDSRHAIRHVWLQLKMVMTYRAGSKRTTSAAVLTKTSLGKIAPRATLEGLSTALRVPGACPPSGLPGCTLIDVQYRVEVKMRAGVWPNKGRTVGCDIVVGTTPLDDQSCFDSPPDYWSCCLPSYEDVLAYSGPPALTTKMTGLCTPDRSRMS